MLGFVFMPVALTIFKNRRGEFVDEIVAASEFSIDKYDPGSKNRVWVSICARAGGGMWCLPVLIVRGQRPGPRLSVLGGIHGDEYDGPEVIYSLFSCLSVEQLCGTLVMVPVCNVPAYEACRRLSPVDGANMARVFPGEVLGTITQQLAYWVGELFIREADAVIDIHSGGLAYDMPLLVGCQYGGSSLDKANVKIARAFSAPVLWLHPEPIPPGRTLSTAQAYGVPAIYTEATGAGGVSSEVLACFVRGVINVMRCVGMLNSAIEQNEMPRQLLGGGNLDVMIIAPCAGFVRMEVKLMDAVVSGQRIGAIYDLVGSEAASLYANRNGIVICVRRLRRVDAGDGVCHITGLMGCSSEI